MSQSELHQHIRQLPIQADATLLEEVRTLLETRLVLAETSEHAPQQNVPQLDDTAAQDRQALQEKLATATPADLRQMSFSEWNAQFEETGIALDDYLPAYGMTLRAYRMEIFEAEKEEGIAVDDFLASLRQRTRSLDEN